MLKEAIIKMSYSSYKKNFSENKIVGGSYDAGNKTVEVITYELENLNELRERIIKEIKASRKIMDRVDRVKLGVNKFADAFESITISMIASLNALTFEEVEEICKTVGLATVYKDCVMEIIGE